MAEGVCTGEYIGQPGLHHLILPHRSSAAAYRYFVREVSVSKSLGLPIIVVANPDSPLPGELKTDVCLIHTDAGTASDEFEELLESFLDDVRSLRPAFDSSVFFAHEYKLNITRNQAAAELVSSVTGCVCRVGLDFTGALGTRQIIDGIMNASWFMADLASQTDEDTGGIKVNVNSCIETGIAIGAGFGAALPKDDARPIYAVCREANPGYGKTTDLPFMLHTSLSIEWYTSDADFLATVHKIARNQRRRIINHELG